MRILHVNQHLAPRGGVETYLLSLLPQVEAAGCSTAVAYDEGDPSLAGEAYQVAQLGQAGAGAERQAHERMTQVLRRFRPDLVHVHNIQNTGALRASLEAAPVVITGHDYRFVCPASNFFFRSDRTVCDRRQGPGCFVNALRKRCMTPRPHHGLRQYRRASQASAEAERFAAVIAPSRYAQQRFIGAGFPADRTTVLPYFCPLDPGQTPRPVPSKPLLTFLGRLSANKGYDRFIAALGQLPKEVSGLIVGNAERCERDLEQMATAAGCADRLCWRSWAPREEIRSILERTSVLVFPSLWPETLGIVGLEAMACGVPVVASDIGGVPDWLADGKVGFRVPPNDPAAIAQAAEKILADPRLDHRMGQEGQRQIRERFTLEGHVEQLLGIYRRAIDPSLPQATPTPAVSEPV